MKIENIRHSLAHLMAYAVQELFPKVKFGIGPAIENGFYYDFDLPKEFSEKDLTRIESKIKWLIKQNIVFKKKNISKIEAKKVFKDQPYKLELIKELPGKIVSIYESGKFTDLCKGPHIKSTKEINSDAFKLTKTAGAYWRGSERNKMLTRIYGVAFDRKREIDQYFKTIEEAEKRDHRKIGKDLDLFSFHEEGTGFAFWHPKGMVLREALMKLHDKIHKEAGYKVISTPILLSEELWHQSGHWNNYKDKMYFTKIENKTFVIKPMNCPGAVLIYKERPRSYKEFPLKFAENGEVHRHEPSGTLHGLFRVRAFRQDDAHIFAQENQIEKEIKDTIKLILDFYKIFKFKDIKIELSTRPEKSIGSDKIWKESEWILEKILNDLKLKFRINKGEGAFYGPKIDFHIKDSLNRFWQCGTIQLDFSMPERFHLEYIDNKGHKKQPVMIHRTVMGSIQRFVGILIEHFAGAFPVWLSPVQVWVIPVGSDHRKYAELVKEKLSEAGIRAEAKTEAETVSKKIREGEIQKIPYLLVVGDKEIKSKSVSVRERGKGDVSMVKLDKLIEKIQKEIENRK